MQVTSSAIETQIGELATQLSRRCADSEIIRRINTLVAAIHSVDENSLSPEVQFKAWMTLKKAEQWSQEKSVHRYAHGSRASKRAFFDAIRTQNVQAVRLLILDGGFVHWWQGASKTRRIYESMHFDDHQITQTENIAALRAHNRFFPHLLKISINDCYW
jgi:hypothetical protein